MLAQGPERSTLAPAAPLAATDLVALWFVLAQRRWRSLAIVPADPRGSSEELVRALVETGTRLSAVPVTAITMTAVDARVAEPLADLQRCALALGPDDTPGPTPDEGGRLLPPGPGRIVIALPPVIEAPMGLAITASSLVAVAIASGRTCLADARRTIDLIGRERIVGCILV